MARRSAWPESRSKFGYLCVEGMVFGTADEVVDPETGEVVPARMAVLPSHYKCPQSGACLPVENPTVWVYPEGEQAMIDSRRETAISAELRVRPD